MCSLAPETKLFYKFSQTVCNILSGIFYNRMIYFHSPDVSDRAQHRLDPRLDAHICDTTQCVKDGFWCWSCSFLDQSCPEISRRFWIFSKELENILPSSFTLFYNAMGIERPSMCRNNQKHLENARYSRRICPSISSLREFQASSSLV